MSKTFVSTFEQTETMSVRVFLIQKTINYETNKFLSNKVKININSYPCKFKAN